MPHHDISFVRALEAYDGRELSAALLLRCGLSPCHLSRQQTLASCSMALALQGGRCSVGANNGHSPLAAWLRRCKVGGVALARMTGASLDSMALALRGRWRSVSVGQAERRWGFPLACRPHGDLLWACYARIALPVRDPLRVAPSLSAFHSE